MKAEERYLGGARRLARRTLPSLLRYKFLHEYGYNKGAVVVQAIVDDICCVVRNYYRRDGDLEPGQLVYNAPAVGEKAGRGKTIAKTKLVPVTLTIVADEDVAAIREHLPAAGRREIRVRRLTHEAFDQGGLLACPDISILTGYSPGAVSNTAVSLRKQGEFLPLRGYVSDMGSFPTHKAAIALPRGAHHPGHRGPDLSLQGGGRPLHPRLRARASAGVEVRERRASASVVDVTRTRRPVPPAAGGPRPRCAQRAGGASPCLSTLTPLSSHATPTRLRACLTSSGSHSRATHSS